MSETRENRLKRIRMRAWHRGTKEMDLVLGRYTDDLLAEMPNDALDALETLMAENDQDLYQWVSGQVEPPARFAPLIEKIARHSGAR